MSKLKTYDVIMTPSEDGAWILKSEADAYIRKMKYKRCLAMAKLCGLMSAFQDGEWYARWINRWHKRWLKIAEEFKPNSTAR